MTDKTDDVSKCGLCGEPMPPGEGMFKYHGFSGDCPKPPLPRAVKPSYADLERQLSERDAELKECVELLDRARAAVAKYYGSEELAKIYALLARIKGTPNLSALQESRDE